MTNNRYDNEIMKEKVFQLSHCNSVKELVELYYPDYENSSSSQQQKINRWFRGDSVPSIDDMMDLANRLKCSVNDLVYENSSNHDKVNFSAISKYDEYEDKALENAFENAFGKKLTTAGQKQLFTDIVALSLRLTGLPYKFNMKDLADFNGDMDLPFSDLYLCFENFGYGSIAHLIDKLSEKLKAIHSIKDELTSIDSSAYNDLIHKAIESVCE